MLITIGAFDGFHKGHAGLLELCRHNAEGDDWGVVSFHPHPYEYVHKTNHSLFTLQEREYIRRLLDIPNMFVLRFDDSLRNLEPETFWKLLREKFNVDGLIMGSDFRFGLNRLGSAESLAELAARDGINRVVIEDVFRKGIYSSSNVRSAVLSGNVSEAGDILGYPFFMMSSIIHGNQRGRTMNFPTANLNLSNHHIIPKSGVYISSVLVNHEFHCGALSIGSNPTFKDVNELRAEVHILDFNGDVYDSVMPVFFLGRIRDVIAFESENALKEQIGRDIEDCRRIYGEVIKRPESIKFFEKAERVYYSQKDFTPEVTKLV